MTTAVAAELVPPQRYTSERYFRLVEERVLQEDDRVELLEGVIVSMAPQSPRHAGTVWHVHRVITVVVGERAVVRAQLPLVLGTHSVPEPDVAVVAGPATLYLRRHPTAALLVVEVAESSLAQDRITKAAIYAAAGVPEFWIVNLRASQIEVSRAPDREAGRYTTRSVARRGERLEVSAELPTNLKFGNVRVVTTTASR